jgi:hypothetical protein
MDPDQREDQPRALATTIEIDGERVDVANTLVVGWGDILEERTKAFVDIEEPVSDTVPTEFNYGVLSDLRGDILQYRTDNFMKPDEGLTDTQIYRELRVRYHPDLYRDKSQEAQDLATEYSQALGALVENGELQPETIRITMDDL